MPRQDEARARVAAIGSFAQIAGFGLAGAVVLPAEDAAGARAAWQSLHDTYAVVILTAAAAGAIGDERAHPAAPLTVVMPT